MKISRLPATPRETLSMSGLLAFILKVFFKGADLFGFRKYPLKNASADFEDWTLLQKISWVYKSKNPIVKAEKGSGLEKFFKNNCEIIKLPEGFKKKSSFSFAAAGDLYKVEGMENSKNLLYEDVAEILFEQDISYANLESQLTKQESGNIIFDTKETPPLCCTKEQFDALKGHKEKKYTLMHTACNHTLDMGEEGVETTLEQLELEGIVDIGTNREVKEQHQGRIIEKNGIKTGFVSATFGLNGKEVPEGKGYLVNVVKFHRKDGKPDLTLLENQITHCRKQGCDLIIASLHWGYEYEFFPRKHQVKLAHKIIESGADIIVAHHAHVIQPVEYYRTRRDPDRIAVIAYSLGNLTTFFSAPHLVLSQVLNLSAAKGVFNGRARTYIESAEVIPVMQVESESAGLPVVRIKKLSDMIKQVEKNAVEEEEEYLAKVAGYANLVFG